MEQRKEKWSSVSEISCKGLDEFLRDWKIVRLLFKLKLFKNKNSIKIVKLRDYTKFDNKMMIFRQWLDFFTRST